MRRILRFVNFGFSVRDKGIAQDFVATGTLHSPMQGPAEPFSLNQLPA
jgi:hypothetical protein